MMKVMAPRPGEIFYSSKPIEINKGRKSTKLLVKNTGDRPIQVGSHFHFFETNKALEFDRAKAFGTHLDIQAGTSVRFEPGDERWVSLVEFGGRRVLWGFNSLTQGSADSKTVAKVALQRAKKLGYRGA